MFPKAITIESLRQFDPTIERENASPMINETEFEIFYNEHSRPLQAYLCRLAGNAAIADDLAQESFMRFLAAPPRSSDNSKAYLYRIATNLTYDYFRRNSLEIKRQANLSSNANEETYESFAAESGIEQVFDKLKMQERALLWLAYVEGCDHDEIARTLGFKSLSVRVLLFRARRKLAALLEMGNLEVKKS